MTTPNYSIPLPIPGGSSGVWGNILNEQTFAGLDTELFRVDQTAAGALARTGGEMTGDLQTHTSRAALVDRGTVSGAVTVDLSNGDVHVLAIDGATTLSFTGWGTDARLVMLELTDAGTRVTWPGTVVWDQDIAPTFQNPGVDVVILYSRDEGATIRAVQAISSGA